MLKSNMDNKKKFQSFLRIARELNTKLGSSPVLYGSLGLSRSLKTELETDDIDLLIENEIFNSELDKIHSLMVRLGFQLIDLEENTFLKGGLKVGIATDGDMLSFSGIDPSALKINVSSSTTYRVLSPKQFLATYRASSLDGYRKETHRKDDGAKIRLIESVLFVSPSNQADATKGTAPVTTGG